MNHHLPCAASGFGLPAAIFLLVVLWLLGAFIVSITGTQQSGVALDAQGVRAYHAARAGIEWAGYHVLDPNNTNNGATPPAAAHALHHSCPAASTVLPALAGSLSVFTVTVTCSSADTTEGNQEIRTYAIVSTATHGTSGTADYVERQLQVLFSKCKDQNAPGPRYACG